MLESKRMAIDDIPEYTRCLASVWTYAIEDCLHEFGLETGLFDVR
jgi:hypothetical protein